MLAYRCMYLAESAEKRLHLSTMMAKEYLGEQLPSQEEVFSGMKKPDPKKADNEQVAAYGAYQAYVALHGKDSTEKSTAGEQVCGICLKRLRCRWYITLDDMEKAGILVEGEALKLYGEQLDRYGSGNWKTKIYELKPERLSISIHRNSWV